jgi:hypothetical protein
VILLNSKIGEGLSFHFSSFILHSFPSSCSIQQCAIFPLLFHCEGTANPLIQCVRSGITLPAQCKRSALLNRAIWAQCASVEIAKLRIIATVD